jgi:cysteine desulfurase
MWTRCRRGCVCPIKLDNIDTLSVSGHKIHAPKGIGALYLSATGYVQSLPARPIWAASRSGRCAPALKTCPTPWVWLQPRYPSGQDHEKRGTPPCRALNRAAAGGASKAFPEVVINSPENAVPEVLNFSENCIKSETMLTFLAEKQIYVSSASACGRGRPSRTLAAMGKDPLAVDTAIRVSFCADNTPEDVQAFLDRFAEGMRTQKMEVKKFKQRIRR